MSTQSHELSSDELHDLLRRTAALCVRKEYCASEIVQKLRAKGATPEQADQLLERLQHEGYTDDLRYARAFVSDKFRFDHWGRLKIAAALRAKALPSHLIDEALHDIDEADYEAAIASFIQSRRRTLKAPDAHTLALKVARAAVNRGYEPHRVFDLLQVDDDLPDTDD